MSTGLKCIMCHSFLTEVIRREQKLVSQFGQETLQMDGWKRVKEGGKEEGGVAPPAAWILPPIIGTHKEAL